MLLGLLMLLSFATSNLYGQARCGSVVEEVAYADLPEFTQADWYSSWDPYYGKHGTSRIKFKDGIEGKIFKGGMTGKFFIGDSQGGKFYYSSQKASVRALYLYKSYGCVTNWERN